MTSKFIFLAKLYTLPDGQELDELPSPEELKGRILIKVRKIIQLIVGHLNLLHTSLCM